MMRDQSSASSSVRLSTASMLRLPTHRISGYLDTIDLRNDVVHEYDREDLVPARNPSVFHPILLEALLNAD